MELGLDNRIVLYANGDVFVDPSITIFFLFITSYGVKLGEVSMSSYTNAQQLCQFSESLPIEGFPKQTAVCSINATRLCRLKNTCDISIKTQHHKHVLNIISVKNDARIILVDNLVGTNWRGCKVIKNDENYEGDDKSSEGEGVIAWKHSFCPSHLCAIPTISIEIANCESLWKIKDVLNITHGSKRHAEIIRTDRQKMRSPLSKVQSDPELVKALTANEKPYKETISLIAVDSGDDTILKCKVRKELMGTVDENDRILFYFVTPNGLQVTEERFGVGAHGRRESGDDKHSKYTLKGASLKINKVYQEDSGVYYCAVEHNYMVTFGSCFKVVVKSCQQTGCRAEQVCSKLYRSESNDFVCVGIEYFISSKLTKGYVSPLWIRITHWICLSGVGFINLYTSFYLLAEILKVSQSTSVVPKEEEYQKHNIQEKHEQKDQEKWERGDKDKKEDDKVQDDEDGEGEDGEGKDGEGEKGKGEEKRGKESWKDEKRNENEVEDVLEVEDKYGNKIAEGDAQATKEGKKWVKNEQQKEELVDQKKDVEEETVEVGGIWV